MGFLEHFEELRKRIFYSIIAVMVGALAAFAFSGRLLDLLTRSIDKLVFLAPSEALVVQLKVALVAGAVVAVPVVAYQFWRFVRPALRRNEARYIVLAVLVGSIFFLGGVAFAYFVMVPFAMKFLLSFGSAKLEPMISIESYVDTVGTFLIAAGCIFQMPVIIFFLTKLGLVKPRTLIRNQRIAIVACFILGAILSPPDVVSQVLMSVPLLVLYEISVLGSYLAAGRRTN